VCLNNAADVIKSEFKIGKENRGHITTDLYQCCGHLKQDILVRCRAKCILFADKCKFHGGVNQQKRQLARFGIFIRKIKRSGAARVYRIAGAEKVNDGLVKALDLFVKREYRNQRKPDESPPLEPVSQDVQDKIMAIDTKERLISGNVSGFSREESVVGAPDEIIPGAYGEFIPQDRKYRFVSKEQDKSVFALLSSDSQLNLREELAIIQDMLSSALKIDAEFKDAKFKLTLIKEIRNLTKVIAELEDAHTVQITLQSIKAIIVRVAGVIRKYVPDPEQQKKAAIEINNIAAGIKAGG